MGGNQARAEVHLSPPAALKPCFWRAEKGRVCCETPPPFCKSLENGTVFRGNFATRGLFCSPAKSTPLARHCRDDRNIYCEHAEDDLPNFQRPASLSLDNCCRTT